MREEARERRIEREKTESQGGGREEESALLLSRTLLDFLDAA